MSLFFSFFLYGKRQRKGEKRKFVGTEQRNEMGIEKKEERGNSAYVLGSKLGCIGLRVN